MLIEASNIKDTDLYKFSVKEILAIKVRNFIGADLAEKLSEKILGEGFQQYINAPSIGRIGMAFYEAENNPILLEKYFDTVFENIDELRNRCLPYVSPIDLLRCKLDEIWPAGANLETLYGKKMYVGLSRIIQPDITFLAHHDIFSKDAPDSFRAYSLKAQIAANIYLAMPTDGGAIQIWDAELSPEEFDRMRGSNYGIDPKLLGDPSIEIEVETGDLVLFNSQCMHSVTSGKDNLRLSLSCFIGYRGPATPLTFWS